jgi:predicted enzyme related to lactoylglutathione lyase
MAEAAAVFAVMLDCNDLDGQAAFWREILGIEERMRFPDYIFLGRMGDQGPRLALQRVPEAKSAKNRMHLDLADADPEALISRVLALGGSRLQSHQMGDTRWTVMADPEGNEFCITPKH